MKDEERNVMSGMGFSGEKNNCSQFSHCNQETDAIPSCPVLLEEYIMSGEEFGVLQTMGGSVFQNTARGTWHYAYYFIQDGKKMRHVERCRDREDALNRQRAYNEGIRQMAIFTGQQQTAMSTVAGAVMGTQSEPQEKSMTVAEYLNSIMESVMLLNVQKSSRSTYLYEMKHIFEGLGDRVLSKVTRKDVLDFVNNLKSKDGTDSSLSTKKKIRGYLHTMFRHAINDGLITRDPTLDIKILSHDEEEDPRDLLHSPDELKRVLSAVQGSPVHEPIIKMLLYTGIRIGELIALSWDRVDLEAGFITIDRALKRFRVTWDEDGTKLETEIEDDASVKSSKGDNYETRVGKTKNKCSRRIAIGGELLAMLRTMRANARPRCEWVFPTKDGALRNYDGLRSLFHRFCAKRGLDSQVMRFHRFRHSFSSYAKSAGIDDSTRQALMGHKTGNITNDSYTKVRDDVLVDAMRAYYHYMKNELGMGEEFGR